MTTSIKPFFILLITTTTQGGVVMHYEPDAAITDRSKWGERMTSAQADAVRAELADRLDKFNNGIVAGGAWALRKDARAALAALSPSYIKGHEANYDGTVVRIVQVGGKTMRDLREVDHWTLEARNNLDGVPDGDWISLLYLRRDTRKEARALAKQRTSDSKLQFGEGNHLTYRAVPVYKRGG